MGITWVMVIYDDDLFESWHRELVLEWSVVQSALLTEHFISIKFGSELAP